MYWLRDKCAQSEYDDVIIVLKFQSCYDLYIIEKIISSQTNKLLTITFKNELVRRYLCQR